MKITGNVHKYGSNVDTDVIIPARYLNEPDHKALASHCMEDIDADFAKKVQPGDIMVADWNCGCGSSREHALQLCPDLLPQLHQHRPAHYGVPRGSGGHRGRGQGLRGL